MESIIETLSFKMQGKPVQQKLGNICRDPELNNGLGYIKGKPTDMVSRNKISTARLNSKLDTTKERPTELELVPKGSTDTEYEGKIMEESSKVLTCNCHSRIRRTVQRYLKT